MVKYLLIAIAIVMSAIYIGDKITQASQPESVKIERALTEQVEAELEKQNNIKLENESKQKQAMFENDLFERIPNANFDSLDNFDKIIFLTIHAVEGYKLTIFFSIAGLLLANVLFVANKGNIKNLVKPRAIPALALVVIFIVVFSFILHATLLSLTYSLIALHYQAIQVILSSTSMMLFSLFVGMLTIKGFDVIYRFLERNNLTIE